MALHLIADDRLARDLRWHEISEAVEDLIEDVDFDQAAHDEWVEREQARFERIEQHMRTRTSIDL